MGPLSSPRSTHLTIPVLVSNAVSDPFRVFMRTSLMKPMGGVAIASFRFRFQLFGKLMVVPFLGGAVTLGVPVAEVLLP